MQTPSHYEGEVQPWDIIAHLKLGYNLGCVVKYCFRAGKKEGNSIEQDLNKAIAYLKEEMERPNQYVFLETLSDFQLKEAYIDSLEVNALLDWLLFSICGYLRCKEKAPLIDCIEIIQKTLAKKYENDKETSN